VCVCVQYLARVVLSVRVYKKEPVVQGTHRHIYTDTQTCTDSV